MKNLKEEISSVDKEKALAHYLEIENDEVAQEYDNVYETSSGEEYFVGTEEEAYDAAIQSAKDIFDDIGFESFTENFKEWIVDNALDTTWFEDVLEESARFYVEDIEDEGSDYFENRQIEEMYENGILTDEDFIDAQRMPNDEDMRILKDDVNLSEKKEEFIEFLSNVKDPIAEYDVQFGDINNVLKEHPEIIDIDAVAEECISWDGVAHYLASYDGDEIELEDNLYAYRIN